MNIWWSADMSAAPLQMRASGRPNTNWIVERSTNPRDVWQGESGIVLTAPDQLYQRAGINKWFPWVTSAPFAFDLWFQIPYNDREIGFEVSLDSGDGHVKHNVSFVWVHDANYDRIGWQRWGPERVAAYGNWLYLPDGLDMTVSRGFNQWHRLQGAVDFKHKRYVSLQIDDHIFDLYGESYEIEDQPQGPYCGLSIMVWSQEANQQPQVIIGAVSVGTL